MSETRNIYIEGPTGGLCFGSSDLLDEIEGSKEITEDEYNAIKDAPSEEEGTDADAEAGTDADAEAGTDADAEAGTDADAEDGTDDEATENQE